MPDRNGRFAGRAPHVNAGAGRSLGAIAFLNTAGPMRSPNPVHARFSGAATQTSRDAPPSHRDLLEALCRNASGEEDVETQPACRVVRAGVRALGLPVLARAETVTTPWKPIWPQSRQWRPPLQSRGCCSGCIGRLERPRWRVPGGDRLRAANSRACITIGEFRGCCAADLAFAGPGMDRCLRGPVRSLGLRGGACDPARRCGEECRHLDLPHSGAMRASGNARARPMVAGLRWRHLRAFVPSDHRR